MNARKWRAESMCNRLYRGLDFVPEGFKSLPRYKDDNSFMFFSVGRSKKRRVEEELQRLNEDYDTFDDDDSYKWFKVRSTKRFRAWLIGDLGVTPEAIKYIEETGQTSALSRPAAGSRPGVAAVPSDGYVYFYHPGHNAVRDDATYGALGNFFQHRFQYKGIWFNCAEAAFQSEKARPADRHQFSTANGKEAFRMSRGLPHLKNNVQTMYDVLWAKFEDPQMRTILAKSGKAVLVEANTTKGRDKIWSNDNDGTGCNILGLLLMHIRDGSNMFNDLVRNLLETGLKMGPNDIPMSTVHDSPLYFTTNKLLNTWIREWVRPTPMSPH
jgi:predicted NAD-dependent protein-ADP-ribosyltransferase YbiA (DUF1768 family)